MVAIYSTLGPARTLVDALRERHLLRVSFALVLVLVVGGIAWRGVKRRPGWREIGVALGVAFAYLMVWIRIDSWEERTHLIGTASWPRSSTRHSWSACATAARFRRLPPSPWR